jgi:hypothetical protein
MIVPSILIGAGMGSFIAAMVMRGGPDFMTRGFKCSEMFLFGGMGILLVLVGVVLAFFILIFLGAAIAHMVKTGQFGKAFALGEILSLIRKIGWGKYLGWIVLVIVIAVIVGGVSGAIPFVGWILRAIVSPILAVFLFRSLGLLYSEGST